MSEEDKITFPCKGHAGEDNKITWPSSTMPGVTGSMGPYYGLANPDVDYSTEGYTKSETDEPAAMFVGGMWDNIQTSVHGSDELKDEIHLISFAKPGDPEEDVVEIPAPNEPGKVWRINKRRTEVLRNIESMEPARSAGEGRIDGTS